MSNLKTDRLLAKAAPEPDGTGGDGSETGGLLHDAVYAELRWRLITGKIVPGIGLSTRGLAQELGVSPMPVREALGRLAAEGAVEIRSKRRITVPGMTEARFDDLLRCRLLLEPEAAKLALPSIDTEILRKLRGIDDRLDLTLSNGDVTGYMEANFRFHFMIYQASGPSILNQLIETLWLQFGPYMRVVYGRFGTRNLVDQHEVALDAIQVGDADALVRAISADIADGMGLIGRHGLV
ncbi:MAG TPA: GntR family transcriptional regulator [Candidatus Sulfotelmatobacter sp.]|jgi:DNA-binding GntR family transcriptional regulator|nr:GntR family transcriptional regulator [Candidatus Sulfotelmatobacter sp.]